MIYKNQEGSLILRALIQVLRFLQVRPGPLRLLNLGLDLGICLRDFGAFRLNSYLPPLIITKEQKT